jgi:hypothetical protein
MALNKKKSSYVCAAHVLAYMVPFLFCDITWVQMELIAVQHFVKDRTGFVLWIMKIKGSARFAEPPMAPWSIILTDNILHILWIALVMRF